MAAVAWEDHRRAVHPAGGRFRVPERRRPWRAEPVALIDNTANQAALPPPDVLPETVGFWGKGGRHNFHRRRWEWLDDYLHDRRSCLCFAVACCLRLRLRYDADQSERMLLGVLRSYVEKFAGRPHLTGDDRTKIEDFTDIINGIDAARSNRTNFLRAAISKMLRGITSRDAEARSEFVSESADCAARAASDTDHERRCQSQLLTLFADPSVGTLPVTAHTSDLARQILAGDWSVAPVLADVIEDTDWSPGHWLYATLRHDLRSNLPVLGVRFLDVLTGQSVTTVD
jgi:hypothetical protein